MFMESSSPSPAGDTSLLISPTVTLSQTHCLSFYYHMYGSTTGTLSVYRQFSKTVRHLLWRRTGNQGNMWRQGKVDIGSGQVKVVFETVEAGGEDDFLGDIGLDDISITQKPCQPGEH